MPRPEVGGTREERTRATVMAALASGLLPGQVLKIVRLTARWYMAPRLRAKFLRPYLRAVQAWKRGERS